MGGPAGVGYSGTVQLCGNVGWVSESESGGSPVADGVHNGGAGGGSPAATTEHGVVDAAIAPTLTPMVVVPGVRAVANPELLMAATPGLREAQTAVEVK